VVPPNTRAGPQPAGDEPQADAVRSVDSTLSVILRRALKEPRMSSGYSSHGRSCTTPHIRSAEEGGALTNSLATYLSEARLKAWNDAIDERHSVRSYQKRPVREEALQSIEGLLRGFSPLCRHARGPSGGSERVTFVHRFSRSLREDIQRACGRRVRG
jgi:hypothetical protein